MLAYYVTPPQIAKNNSNLIIRILQFGEGILHSWGKELIWHLKYLMHADRYVSQLIFEDDSLSAWHCPYWVGADRMLGGKWRVPQGINFNHRTFCARFRGIFFNFGCVFWAPLREFCCADLVKNRGVLCCCCDLFKKEAKLMWTPPTQ